MKLTSSAACQSTQRQSISFHSRGKENCPLWHLTHLTSSATRLWNQQTPSRRQRLPRSRRSFNQHLQAPLSQPRHHPRRPRPWRPHLSPPGCRQCTLPRHCCRKRQGTRASDARHCSDTAAMARLCFAVSRDCLFPLAIPGVASRRRHD